MDFNISILLDVFLRLIANLAACQSIVTRKLQLRNVFFLLAFSAICVQLERCALNILSRKEKARPEFATVKTTIKITFKICGKPRGYVNKELH